MPTSYNNAVAQMYALGHELANLPSAKFDLAHMRALLSELHHPETKFPSVLIAGTNGKGSTAATLASILQAAGQRTGLYTSPHLVRINERIRVNGEPISDRAFAALHDRVEQVSAKLVSDNTLPWHPSFFETLTAMAFLYFAELPVEIAVLEVGMGGRLDATNVVEPLVSVISDIALDHQKFLGNTLGEIAREKAGIIRPNGVTVTLPQMPEANDAIGNTILERGARAVNATQYVPPVSPNSGDMRVASAAYDAAGKRCFGQEYRLSVLGKEILVHTPLIGRHQLRNVALAIATTEELNRHGFKVTAENVERGIRETNWPGRFQFVQGKVGPDYILDVAHNPAGAWALRAALSEALPERPLTIVFGVMRDKSIGEMAEILFPLAEHVVVTRADNPRSASPEEILTAAHRVSADAVTAEDVAAAIERANQIAGPNSVIVITGSIFVVGEAMQALGVQP